MHRDLTLRSFAASGVVGWEAGDLADDKDVYLERSLPWQKNID